ncbi:MAG: dTDP-4-dehydrorhamnose 3,5-epimerase family protein [Planctomycetota bacterium]
MANRDFPDRPFTKGPIEDVHVKKLAKWVDERGWLAELYRDDELPDPDYRPTMSYLSVTEPETVRGPHEHEDQADNFVFLGPGNFKLVLWDNRPDRQSYWNKMVLFVGADNPASVIVPKGVVHAYKCISSTTSTVINLPNRLYAGEGKKEPVDEYRHEDDPATPFRVDG